MTVIQELCWRLTSDMDAEVQMIGRRCLRDYDEFSGLRYADITSHDARHLAAVARDARRGPDGLRADLLDEAVRMVDDELARTPLRRMQRRA